MTDCNCIDCQYGKPDTSQAANAKAVPKPKKIMNKFRVSSIAIGDHEITVVGIVRKRVKGKFKDAGPGCMITFDKCSPGDLHAKLAKALSVHDVVEITGIYQVLWSGEE